MATEPSPPSANPADQDSLAGAFRLVLEKFLQNVDDMLPAMVTAYDRASNRATVRPMIMLGTTDGQKLARAPVASVPVLNIGGGDFLLSFPIKAGDLGWIKASDRDISLFLQGLAEDWPNTRRAHSFSDGLFIPDRMREWSLNEADAERAVFQSADGVTRIAIGADTVEITTTGTIKLDAPAVAITGDLQVDGAINADGGVTGADIVLETHTHSGVTAGAANTGAPNP